MISTNRWRTVLMSRAAVFLAISTIPAGGALAFEVCLVGGNSAALSFWLDTFQNNGEDDEIRLRAGTFVVPDSGFLFTSSESHDLIVSGGWNTDCSSRRGIGDTVLDGGQSEKVMGLKNRNGRITVSHLTFADGYLVSLGINGYAGGLQVNGDDGLGTGATIELNKFFFNTILPAIGEPGIGSAGLYASTASGTLRVRNNLFVGNEGGGGAAAWIRVNASSVAHVTSNTVVLNGTDGLFTGGMLITSDSGNEVTVSNNILWGNSGNSLEIPNGAVVTNNDIQGIKGNPGSGSIANVNIDPLFDGVLGFKLKPASPLVNAGRDDAPGGLTATDLFGSVRAQGAAVDMGAYETDVVFIDDFD